MLELALGIAVIFLIAIWILIGSALQANKRCQTYLNLWKEEAARTKRLNDKIIKLTKERNAIKLELIDLRNFKIKFLSLLKSAKENKK